MNLNDLTSWKYYDDIYKSHVDILKLFNFKPFSDKK